ncbi:DUF2306 domain-containing protein [Mycobacterium sp.]|uniref:DUF2306 domain-containing protein n=1 Tax=Mycobacterium sp. TaxID=1785 RepID=UPI002CD8DB6C|nr:DUF2306 domain-containing protein [Mycobacterium sp.]HKP43518.1 DUF2306 domain-containing protein [Mycobacterium sp.]
MLYADRRPKVLATALAVIVVIVLAYSLPPNFTGGTRVPVMFASVVMVTAVAQIWPGLRARRPALHRRAGRVYVYAAIPAVSCAMVIGAATPFGPFLAVSNVLLASLWSWFTINGYLAGRRRRSVEHRRHMIRGATLALSIVTNRIWTPVLFVALYPLRDSVFRGDDEHFVWMVAGVGAWLGWTIPLGAVQWWLNRRHALASSSISQLTNTSPV